jgi:vanillate O-demethylase monooxygenase subunit
LSREFAPQELQGHVIAERPLVVWRTLEGHVVAFDERCATNACRCLRGG